ncbi:MAG: hypothetical protein JWN62_2582 [Acidimicrobiales bacterium]|nr:hypothetical protein [Acidimicrobiales bacterium]
MKKVAPLLDGALALAGVFAVLAMGGGWKLVSVVVIASGTVTFFIWRRGGAPAPRRRRPTLRRRNKSAKARTFRQQQRHDLWRVARSIIAVVLIWNLVSFVSYVGRDNGDTLSERIATWGRDNNLGGVIDFLETRMYSTPPSKQPAKQLALAPSITAPTFGGPTTVAAPAVPDPTTTTTAATAGADPAGGAAGPPATPAAATTLPDVPAPLPPAPLQPLFQPALAGEGQWTPIAQAAGQDAMWATSIRPFPAAGGVVASMVVIDQTHLRAGLFNGAEEPGGNWKRGNRVPAELQPALVAAMNGGFRFEHIKGGYVTEGVTVKPLRDGDATLAIGKDGHVVIGQLGRDLFDDGSWISLRQNLELIVDNGQSQVQHGIADGVWWGADYGNRVYVPRSAVCELPDGRIAYALVGRVDATQLAESLINIGCVKAMQMDINGTWPVFFTFGLGADGAITSHFLDQRMGGDPNRYLNGSTKEFFAFFDATLVPAGSVLDS